MTKKVGRVVGSRYLQKTETIPASKSSQPQSDSAPKRRLSKPLTELKQVPVSRTNASNIAQSCNKVKSTKDKGPASNGGLMLSEASLKTDAEHELLSWAYLYQQCRLSLDDYQQEHDNFLTNLTGQVVQLNEELYEKQSLAENDKNLEADVTNLKSALASILRINNSLDVEFLDRYDELSRELGVRINEIELENATLSDQDMESTLSQINGLMATITADFGHNLKICKETLVTLCDVCASVNDGATENANLLNQINQEKIKNMGLFNSTKFQSEDSNK